MIPEIDLRDIINKSLSERGLPILGQPLVPINSIFGTAQHSSPKKPLSEDLDEETYLRFGYVPFVIAEVAWDYVDTVLDLTKIMRRSETKKLCRAIMEFRKEYLWWKRDHIGAMEMESEEDNMIAFQEDLNDFFNKMYYTNRNELSRQYPDLEENSRMMIATVYMAVIVFDALFKYVKYMEGEIIKKVKHPIGNILPKQLKQIAMLVPEFAGDSPMKEDFDKNRTLYVNTLVNHIKSIQLYD